MLIILLFLNFSHFALAQGSGSGGNGLIQTLPSDTLIELPNISARAVCEMGAAVILKNGSIGYCKMKPHSLVLDPWSGQESDFSFRQYVSHKSKQEAEIYLERDEAGNLTFVQAKMKKKTLQDHLEDLKMSL